MVVYISCVWHWVPVYYAWRPLLNAPSGGADSRLHRHSLHSYILIDHYVTCVSRRRLGFTLMRV